MRNYHKFMSDTRFQIIALPTRTADAVRETMRAPGYGHPATSEVATGPGPCRHCLRPFAIGDDKRILFTYDPFADNESLPLPGPIFVHADACERYAASDGFPKHLRSLALTFNAYGRGRKLREQAYASNGDIDATIERLLSRPDVDYIHVRRTDAGCFAFRIERSEGTSVSVS